MSPDGKECNEWTEWVNEVSAGGRDKERTEARWVVLSLFTPSVPTISPLTRRFPLLLRFGDPPGGEDERRE